MPTVLEVVNSNVLPACFQQALRRNGEIILPPCVRGHPSVLEVWFFIREDGFFPPEIVVCGHHEASIYQPCAPGDSLSLRVIEEWSVKREGAPSDLGHLLLPISEVHLH